MGLNKFALFICLGGLSMIPPILTAFVKTVALDTGIGWKFAQLKQPLSQPKLEHLRHQAQSITVKVLSQDYLGSGILIKKQDTVYTVLTNAHVLRADDPPYRIQTPDGRIYPANLLKSLSFSKTDLALLQFRNATSIYTVASLASSTLVGDEVFVGGFPFDEDGTQVKNFSFTPGKVSLILNKPLEGGYQIGYTNLVKKGMSGGPLLNKQGEVIGINGMHAYPLWDVPSVFMDGSQADKDLHETINRLSWAVPMDTVLRVR